MRTLTYFLILLPFLSFAQVGVNTTTPNGALDIQSTNNGVLIPRVQLTNALDNTTVVNPAGGALATSTLIYNIGVAGVTPNDVVSGFYYWNGTKWIAIAGNTTTPWSLNGNVGTNPPTLIGNTLATTENFIGTTDSKDLFFGTNNMSRMKISSFGNVGIGIDNPFAKFHVFENAAPGGVAVYIRQNSTGALGSNTALAVNSVSSSANKTNYAAEFTATGSNLQRNVAATFLASGATNNHAIIVPPTSGNIGFGTSTPNLAHLQVEGMIGNTIALFRNTPSSQGISLIADWPGLYFNSYYNAGQRTMAANGFPSIVNTDQSSGGLTFHTSNIANTASDALISVPERMRIDANGNVGIGTVSPVQPLHVYKNSNTTKNVIFAEAIQTNIGPDYQNRGVVGYASGVPASSGFGFAVGVMGIGDKTNSYYATGVYAHLGSTPPNLYDGNQALYANGNGLGLAGVFVGGDVVIGASSSNSTAALNVVSTTKGVAFPKMTRAQRNAIVLPIIGLMIFQSDFTPGLRVYNGTNWMRFSEIID